MIILDLCPVSVYWVMHSTASEQKRLGQILCWEYVSYKRSQRQVVSRRVHGLDAVLRYDEIKASVRLRLP